MGCETSRLPDFLDTQLRDCSKAVKPYAPAALYPKKILVLISVPGRVKKNSTLTKKLVLLQGKSDYNTKKETMNDCLHRHPVSAFTA
jgi:hypothetical protein